MNQQAAHRGHTEDRTENEDFQQQVEACRPIRPT